MPTPEDLARSYTEAWCSQNPDRVAAHYTPSGSLTINNGPPARGRTAIAASARAFMEAFPDMRVTLDRLVDMPDRIEYHWTLTGTNSGPGGTGNKVEISGHESWHLDPAGLIENSQGHFDEAEYARQLQKADPA